MHSNILIEEKLMNNLKLVMYEHVSLKTPTQGNHFLVFSGKGFKYMNYMTKVYFDVSL